VAVALLLSGSLWLWHQYQSVYVLEQNKTQQIASLFNLKSHQRWEAYPGGDEIWENHANVVTQKALSRGDYRPPVTALELHRKDLMAALDSSVSRISVTISNERNFILLSNRTLDVQEEDMLFAILWSNQRVYVKPVNPLQGGERAYVLSGKRFYPVGFYGQIDRNRLLPGTYSLRVGRLRKQEFKRYDTGQSLVIGP
jgi:hypothetical protein